MKRSSTVWHVVFFLGMMAIVLNGESLADLTWRQWLAVAAAPWLLSYAAYHMGEINGFIRGFDKGRGKE